MWGGLSHHLPTLRPAPDQPQQQRLKRVNSTDSQNQTQHPENKPHLLLHNPPPKSKSTFQTAPRLPNQTPILRSAVPIHVASEKMQNCQPCQPCLPLFPAPHLVQRAGGSHCDEPHVFVSAQTSGGGAMGGGPGGTTHKRRAKVTDLGAGPEGGGREGGRVGGVEGREGRHEGETWEKCPQGQGQTH